MRLFKSNCNQWNLVLGHHPTLLAAETLESILNLGFHGSKRGNLPLLMGGQLFGIGAEGIAFV